jgi:hypothetical protein
MSMLRFLLISLLFIVTSSSLLADTKTFSSTNSILSSGKRGGAKFTLSIANVDSADTIKTSDDVDLILNVKPAESDIGKKADLFNVVQFGKTWWMLTLDGVYVPWSLSLKKLEPFKENVNLETDFDVSFLSGNFSASKEIKYFFAYLAEDENALNVTPKAFKFSVEESDGTNSSGVKNALSLYEKDIEKNVVQKKCIACHVTGGLARDTFLIFSRENELSIENNFNTFKNLIAEKNDFGKYILSKVNGGASHQGGVQISKGSDEYVHFSAFIDALASSINPNSRLINFGEPTGGSRNSSNILSNIILEDDSETLRRAALLFAGRAPTNQEKSQFLKGDESDRRGIISNLMSEPYFHNFIVESVENRLFLHGGDGPGLFNAHLSPYAYLRQAVCDAERDLPPNTQDNNLRGKIMNYARRTGHELFYHVISNDLPYSEILTADYMMMNNFLNDLLKGSASFRQDEDETVFKPSKIQGYFEWDQYDQSEELVNRFPCPENLGDPVSPFPHAGILSDQAYLDRYPTTATNRNRARARWTLYHFLDIDVEKSSQRPVDPEVLADTNNPTMNNPSCTVCHAVLDPVAGAFQNWNDFSLWQPVGGALDLNYKHPPDGSETEYEYGDYWYRDMRPPGLFEKTIEDQDYALQELASLIVKEPGFRTSAVKFWWPAVFGSPLLDRPASPGDYGYQEAILAYDTQQEAVQEFANGLGQSNLNIKDMFINMVLSPWFRAELAEDSEFANAQLLSDLGSEHKLTPHQLFEKTKRLGGYAWGHRLWNLDRPWLGQPTQYGHLQQLRVLYGGTDSKGVLSLQQELTPMMLSVALNNATTSACPIVLKEFIKDSGSRRLFSLVEEVTTPNSSPGRIKDQIIRLYSKLHGKQYSNDDYEVEIVFELFESVWSDKRRNTLGDTLTCRILDDGTYFDEILGELGLENTESFITFNEEYQVREFDWPAAWEIIEPHFQDPNYTKNAWVAVMIYMLSHYDYLYE